MRNRGKSHTGEFHRLASTQSMSARRWWGSVAGSGALLLTGCGTDEPIAEVTTPPPLELSELEFLTNRDPCAEHHPWRTALFGDLHVHTLYSFDAGAYETRVTAEEAYRFARGETIQLPPLDANGGGTRPVRLERPLDFAAVTDHGEFLGEVYQCTTPGMPGYESSVCELYRDTRANGALQFGSLLGVAQTPGRFPELCGPDGTGCEHAARHRWRELQIAAEHAYDRTARCSFTSFVAYEYTNTRQVSNQHRNIVFASARVPYLPVTYFEATPEQLWQRLASECIDGDPECDAISIPHNSNLSNGRLFTPQFETDATEAEQRALLELRARIEPIAEIFQHKGDSECRNGLSGTGATERDPLCDFEKLRPPDDEDCEDDLGTGGMRLRGCSHRLDFLRNVLKEGLVLHARVGANPFHFGFIGSTDSHNGAPGLVSSTAFPGHIGTVDDTTTERLGDGNVTHDGIVNNPGGLAGVWAEENSRPAIFAALRRGETFATSGPRIEVRFFGGWALADACSATHEAMLARGYEDGVPMGSDLPPLPEAEARPTFVVQGRADAGTVPLQRLQIIKGWLDAEGHVHERVIDVEGSAETVPPLDTTTCRASQQGWQERCRTWIDPDFDPHERAFYYARVLENPTCRWSTLQCNALPAAARPAHCNDGVVASEVQHRAWSSPIWFTPVEASR